MINNIKKLTLPLIGGLIMGGLDLAFWIWFLAYAILYNPAEPFAEGLMGMMFFHMPASMLLPFVGAPIIMFLRGLFDAVGANSYLIPQTIFLFAVGIIQSFFLGYLLGSAVVWLRRRTGFDKSLPTSSSEPGRVKAYTLNILYFAFTFSFIQMINNRISEALANPELFRENYPPFHYIIIVVFILVWLIASVGIYGFDRKVIKIKNKKHNN